MNILILSGRFGMGHNSAAKAIQKEVKKIDKTNKVEIVDLIEYIYPEFTELIYGGFNKMVNKYYKLYNVMYKISEKLEVDMKLSGNKINHRIGALLNIYQPDLIIATLPLCARTMSAYKGLNKLDIPLITCVTDISMHVEWVSKNTDFYLVPTRNVKESLIKRGVGADKIAVIGVPVKDEFYNISPIQDRKDNILVMGGGLGLIPDIDRILKILSLYKDKNIRVITGNNKELYERLKNKYPEMEIIGFTDRVYQYMADSDFIISKAGGITLFECIYSKLPMFVIKPFLAQEISNARFIEKQHLGKVIWNGNIDVELRLFIEDTINKKIMRQNMLKLKTEMIEDNLNNVMTNIIKACDA